mmetsp:Transcript_13318/g.31358  ORF Transcript_13318/g.31358 Transcript_13318/m.31358 type:complete len:683 (+) Transcript_13318:149-2197(+)
MPDFYQYDPGRRRRFSSGWIRTDAAFRDPTGRARRRASERTHRRSVAFATVNQQSTRIAFATAAATAGERQAKTETKSRETVPFDRCGDHRETAGNRGRMLSPSVRRADLELGVLLLPGAFLDLLPHGPRGGDGAVVVAVAALRVEAGPDLAEGVPDLEGDLERVSDVRCDRFQDGGGLGGSSELTEDPGRPPLDQLAAIVPQGVDGVRDGPVVPEIAQGVPGRPTHRRAPLVPEGPHHGGEDGVSVGRVEVLESGGPPQVRQGVAPGGEGPGAAPHKRHQGGESRGVSRLGRVAIGIDGGEIHLLRRRERDGGFSSFGGCIRVFPSSFSGTVFGNDPFQSRERIGGIDFVRFHRQDLVEIPFFSVFFRRRRRQQQRSQQGIYLRLLPCVTGIALVIVVVVVVFLAGYVPDALVGPNPSTEKVKRGVALLDLVHRPLKFGLGQSSPLDGTESGSFGLDLNRDAAGRLDPDGDLSCRRRWWRSVPTVVVVVPRDPEIPEETGHLSLLVGRSLQQRFQHGREEGFPGSEGFLVDRQDGGHGEDEVDVLKSKDRRDGIRRRRSASALSFPRGFGVVRLSPEAAGKEFQSRETFLELDQEGQRIRCALDARDDDAVGRGNRIDRRRRLLATAASETLVCCRRESFPSGGGGYYGGTAAAVKVRGRDHKRRCDWKHKRNRNRKCDVR